MDVHLRPVSKENLHACLALRVPSEQSAFVEPVAHSLAEAYVDSNLHPYAIYDGAARGYEATDKPVVGFAVLQIAAGVGFVLRLLVDQASQGKGYGHAAMRELVRRARSHLDVETVATSHRKENVRMARLCADLGFVPWQVDYATEDGPETFLVYQP